MITNRRYRKEYDVGFQRGLRGEKPLGLHWGRPEDTWDIRMAAREAGQADGHYEWRRHAARLHEELHGEPLPPPTVTFRPGYMS